MEFSEQLNAHLSRFATAPFLFVGSGFARRYAGTEDWAAMLEIFAAETAKPYARYSSRANGNLPAIASAIAEEFHDVWWESEKFLASRDKWPNPKGRSSPLKYEVSTRFAKSVDKLPEDGELAVELETLRDATVEGVITTNYDGILEYVFPDFTAFIGQDELLFRDPQGVAEIYKIHGSYSRPESLVLTAEDYERFDSRNPYLAAKLLTVFVEHPIIFLGYSLSDDNILKIITSIAAVLTNDNLDELKDRLLFVQWDPNAVSPTMTESTISAEGVPIPIQLLTVSRYLEVFEVLGQLKRRFPARILRHLKEQVYELVRTSEPSKTTIVSDIESDVDAATVDVVIGVGVVQRLAEQGITGKKRRDILLDVLEPQIESRQHLHVVENLLPTLLAGKTHTPVFRYLRGAKLLEDDGSFVDGADIPLKVRVRARLGTTAFKPKGAYYSRKIAKLLGTAPTLAELTKLAPKDALLAIPSLDPGAVDAAALRKYLVKQQHLLDGTNVFEATQWVKCVCFFDLVANRSTSPTSVPAPKPKADKSSRRK